jgi:hypothetical protein
MSTPIAKRERLLSAQSATTEAIAATTAAQVANAVKSMFTDCSFVAQTESEKE